MNLHFLIGESYLHQITGIPETEPGEVKIRRLTLTILLVNSSVIPFAIMLVASVATFVGVLRVHRRMKSSLGRRRDDSQRRLVQDIKFGVTMIVLDVLFFICVGLNLARYTININPFNRHTQRLASHIFILVLMNLSDYYYWLNFYIQLAINSVLRNELRRMFIRIYKKLKFLFITKIIPLFN